MADAATIQARLQSVRQRMEAAGLDALLVSNPENRYYVTGFYGHDGGQDSAGRVLITPDQLVLFTDSRYSEQAREEMSVGQVEDHRGPLAELLITRLGLIDWPAGERKVIGIEAQHLTVALYQQLEDHKADLYVLKATTDIIEPLRAVKDAEEIALTRKATEITCQTFDHLRQFLKQENLTEDAVAAEIITTMRRLGAEDVAFAPIVAGGPNGARPHAIPGSRVLQPHEPIVIDMGAKYRGYCADMTRTVFLDSAPDIWKERYHHVLAALLACEDGLHADVSGKEADALARNSLAAVDLAQYFTHSTGHGTGLEIHEAPNLSTRMSDKDLLPAGAIVTIEPGIYLTGEGGIRIEDAAVITETGCDILTTSPKDIESMIIYRKEVFM